MQKLSEIAKQVRRRGGERHLGLLGNEAIRRVGWEGRWLMMKNHGVEISIAGSVEEMVRDPLGSFCFFVYIMYYLLDTRTHVQR